MNQYPITCKVRSLTCTKKRTFTLHATDTVAPRGGWCGGVRSYFDGLNYVTGEEVKFHIGDFFSVQTKEQSLPPNTILIETGSYNARPARACIYHRPEELEAVKKFLELS